jgi:hypothetical protein
MNEVAPIKCCEEDQNRIHNRHRRPAPVAYLYVDGMRGWNRQARLKTAVGFCRV